MFIASAPGSINCIVIKGQKNISALPFNCENVINFRAN